LGNHFGSVVGQAPSTYLRAVRLNACRRALQCAPRTGTVQDVAAQWGFFHMGRFSQDYKALFGELPSHTLRQTSQGA
jgi:AraC family ethanolamine operon transcriptional activator